MVAEATEKGGVVDTEGFLNQLRNMGPDADKESLLKQARGFNKDDKESMKALVQGIEAMVNENDAEIAKLQKEVEDEIKRKYKSGELVKPEEPKQPGWENPDLRKALRNMRDTKEVALWYRYAPEIFENEQLTETIMQGVWVDVRKSDEFDSGFKEDMRIKKRQYVVYSADLTFGFDPNVTKKLHTSQASALDNLRKRANKRLTEQGPELFFAEWDKNIWTDKYDNPHTDKEGSIAEEYQKLIATHNASHPEDKAEDMANIAEREDVRFNAGFSMYDQVAQNLADDEFTLMPGMLRDFYVVMRNMEVSQLTHYGKRDLDVKIPIVEFFIKQFKDEVLGKGEMTRKNGLLFLWFVVQAGQSFIPFEALSSELKDWYEIIKAILGRPGDVRAGTSVYPKLQDDKAGGDNSLVMQKINEYRAAENLKREKKGLSPLKKLTVATQPFGRIGVAKK